jgi:hypothetical protein
MKKIVKPSCLFLSPAHQLEGKSFGPVVTDTLHFDLNPDNLKVQSEQRRKKGETYE